VSLEKRQNSLEGIGNQWASSDSYYPNRNTF
jgi:hypothetical protein